MEDGHIIAYGIDWSPLKVGNQSIPLPEWLIHRDLALRRHGCESIPGYLGQAWHFMRFCDAFFSDPRGLFHMEWNPNAVKIVEKFFDNKMLAIMGAASSSKSFTLACIAVGMYLLDPKNTKVLVTSTTVQTAKGKIWGDISYAWDQVCAVYKSWGVPPPGKKMTGDPIIRYESDGIISHKAGLELIPTQQSSEKQSMEKVQGYKNQNIIFVGDEWDTLGHGLINTVQGNLKANPNSRCLAAFNPTGRTTAGGNISKPIGGWETIDEHTYEWQTQYGICIRFDARQSPNVLAGRKLWIGLPTIEDLAAYETLYGENKPLSWWCVDDKTEALTKRGWLKYNEIKIGDMIYSLSKCGTAEWCVIDSLFISNHKGMMTNMDGVSFSALVTQDHKWPITNRQTLSTKKPLRIKRLRKTCELKKNDLIPLIREPSDKKCIESKYNTVFSELLGWIISDGTIDYNRGMVVIYQSERANPNKCKRIEYLLNTLGYKFSLWVEKCGVRHYQLQREASKSIILALPKKKVSMELIESMSFYCRTALLDGIIGGDGGRQSTSGTGMYCCTASEEHAAMYCALAARCGIATTTHKILVPAGKKPLSNGWMPPEKIIYQVNLRKSYHTQKDDIDFYDIEYNGIIWCPYSKNETFLMRRCGRTCFTGNSMVCAWFPPTGETTSIYSEAELLLQYHADHKVTTWLEEPTMIGGADPGYAHDGDASYFSVGKVGLASVNGRSMIVCELVEMINIDRNITDKKVDKSEQVVKGMAEIMLKYGIAVKNLAVDISGAAAFGSLLSREIGSGFIPAVFNSKATEMFISKSDKRRACDVYEDLVSELWYGGKPLIREGQLKGIDPDTIDEMCQRSYLGGGKAKIKVEPKKFMKKRLHKSPDRSDAFFLMVHVARMRHGLSSMELAANHKARTEPLTDLGKFYQDNPHLLPPKPSRFKKRTYEKLEVSGVSWG